MPTTALNEKTVKNLCSDNSSWGKTYYDNKLPNFGIMISKNGTSKYIIRYRCNGYQRTYRIGNAENWTYAAAKAEARTLLVRVDKGDDPFLDKQNLKNRPKLKDLWEIYKSSYQSKESTASCKDQDSMWRNYIEPALGNKYVQNISHQDMQNLHKKITQKGYPYRANRVLETVRRVFNISIRLKMREDNPCNGFIKNRENPRERYLTRDELSRLRTAIKNHPNTKMANIVLLLMLTGARKGEVLGATWEMFNLQDRIWTKPAQYTKQRKMHRTPISSSAVQLLQKIRQTTNSRYVFPQNDNPEDHVKDIKKFWNDLLLKAEIKDFRVHDLRHNFASILVTEGLSLSVIGKLLGHTQPNTTHRYAHLADSALKEATNTAARIMNI